MKSILFLLASLSYHPQVAVADFSLGGWPAPADISSNKSLVAKAFFNITSTLRGYIDGHGDHHDTLFTTPPTPPLISGIENLTFSLGLFSLHDPATSETLQYHYTAPEIACGGNGTVSVNADSIYRIASVTKVLTVLAGLINLKSSDWERPLADIFPVLLQYEAAHPGGTLMVDWATVTPRNLAAQISGLPRDGFPSLNELQILQYIGASDPSSMGFPSVNSSDPLQNPPCASYLTEAEGTSGGDGSCPETPYLQSSSNRPPVFNPWSTPNYANNGFVILGMALAQITNTSYADLVQKSIFDPLGMTSSSIPTPLMSLWNRSVIAYPQDPTRYFDIDAGVLSGSGAASMSQRDMARLGLGILGSKLLPPADTRRWLKPLSFTGRLQYAVGAPWEIHRYTQKNNKVVDLYTKSGDSGGYSSFLVLIPDYDLGFSLMSASSSLTLRFDILAAISDVVTNKLVPAIDAQASAEACEKYAGTYSAGMSSLTIVVNQTAGSLAGPGLVISNWTSSGIDMLRSKYVDVTGLLPYRLVPSIPDPTGHFSTFRMVTATDEPSAQLPISSRLFSGRGFIAADWIVADSLTYGGIGTSLFDFNLAPDGKATSVVLSAFRETLERQR